MSASKSGKIAGIVVYKPKVTTSKVTVEIRTLSIHVITSKFSEILGSTTYLTLRERYASPASASFVIIFAALSQTSFN